MTDDSAERDRSDLAEFEVQDKIRNQAWFIGRLLETLGRVLMMPVLVVTLYWKVHVETKMTGC